MKMTIVTVRQPCPACYIVEEELKGMVSRLQALLPGLQVEWAVYETAREAMGHPALEMPAFPAVFWDGEQVTAGSLPRDKDIRQWMKE